MSLKSVAEKLAEDLAKVGKKLDRSILNLAERVDRSILESFNNVPGLEKISSKSEQLAKKQEAFAAKGFDGLPASTKKTMLDGLIQIADATPTNAGKTKAAIDYLNTLRQNFPEGKAGDDAFKKFGRQFAENLDQDMKAGVKPEAIRNATGPAAHPRAATPVSERVEPTMNGNGHGNRNDPPSRGADNGFDDHNPSPDPSPDLKKIGRELDRLRESSFMYRLQGGVTSGAHSVGKLTEEELARQTARLEKEGVLGKADRLADANDVAKSVKARDMLEFLHQHINAEEYRKLPLVEGTLSPVKTLDALKSGNRVSPESIERLDKYFQKNHLSAEAATATGANAKAFMDKVTGTLLAPIRAANVAGDARTSFGLRSGTASVLLAGTAIVGSWAHGMESPELGRNAGNIFPPTAISELFEITEASKQGVDALSAGGEWAIAQANGPFWGAGRPEFKQELMDAAKAYKNSGADTSKMTAAEKAEHLKVMSAQNPKFAKLTIDQLEAGLYLIEQSAKATTIQTAVAEAAAQNNAVAREVNAQAALISPSQVPMLDIPGSGLTSQQGVTQPAYTEYQVDGATFDNRLKGISYNNEPLYKALSEVFKKETKAPVKPEEELTAANKLSKSEAAIFAEEAKTLLSAQNVEPERAAKIVELLIKPVATDPSLSR